MRPHKLFALAVVTQLMVWSVPRPANSNPTQTSEYHGAACVLTSDSTSIPDARYMLGVSNDGAVITPPPAPAQMGSVVCPALISTTYSRFSLGSLNYSVLAVSNPSMTSFALTCSLILDIQQGSHLVTPPSYAGGVSDVQRAYVVCNVPNHSGIDGDSITIMDYKVQMIYTAIP